MEPFKRKRNVPRGQQKDNISVWSRKKYFSSSMNAERLDIILPIVGSNMNQWIWVKVKVIRNVPRGQGFLFSAETVGLPLDPLGPCRPIPWPHGTLQAYPLTPWNPLGLPLEPLGSPKPTPRPPGNLYAYPLTSWDPVSLPLDPLGHCRPTPWPPRTLSPVGLSLNPKGPCRPTPWPPGTLWTFQ